MAPTTDPRPTETAAGETSTASRLGFLGTGWAKFSDNAIPTLAVAFIAGLVMFNFNETGDRLTRLEDRVIRLEERITGVEVGIARLDGRITALEDRITKLEEDIDARFTRLEDDIDARFTRLEDDIDARFEAVDTRFAQLENTQQEILLTLAMLVTLLETGDQALTIPDG